MQLILENHKMAAEEQMPMCQDTGVAVVFVELGQDVHLVGGDFYEAINEGVRQGYIDGYLRKSIVKDPVIERNLELERCNQLFVGRKFRIKELKDKIKKLESIHCYLCWFSDKYRSNLNHKLKKSFKLFI